MHGHALVGVPGHPPIIWSKRCNQQELHRRHVCWGSLSEADENVRWMHGRLFSWWPPHRKRRAALLVSAALAAPVDTNNHVGNLSDPSLQLLVRGLHAEFVLTQKNHNRSYVSRRTVYWRKP